MMLKDDSVFVPHKVTAVAKKCPQNSSIKFEMLVADKRIEGRCIRTVKIGSTFFSTHLLY